MKKFELIKFTQEGLSIDVRFDPSTETIWLSQEEIASLYGVDRTVINRHISNIYNSKELLRSTCAKNAQVQIEGNRQVERTIYIYNLDMIISLGYRVNTKQGIIFRRWANSVLKDYLLKGYAINEKRLEALNKTIEIQNKMIASVCDIDVLQVKEVINSYTDALTTLDNYDHQCLPENNKKEDYIPLEYEELRKIINEMEYSGKSDVFELKKNKGS